MVRERIPGQRNPESEVTQMLITLRNLLHAGACQEQREDFEELFGESVEITVDTAMKHAEVFDWSWAASMLPPVAYDRYHETAEEASKTYNKVRDAARNERDKIVTPLYATYENTRKPIRAKLDAAIERAMDVFTKATEPARAKCDQVYDRTWLDYDASDRSAAEYHKAVTLCDDEQDRYSKIREAALKEYDAVIGPIQKEVHEKERALHSE